MLNRKIEQFKLEHPAWSHSDITNLVQHEVDDRLAKVHANYSLNVAAPMTRFSSGATNAIFNANDFYNIQRLASDDPQKAKKEWRSRCKLDAYRVIVSTYVVYTLTTLFKRLTNLSMPFAVGLNVASILGTEILSRMLAHKPVLPIREKPKPPPLPPMSWSSRPSTGAAVRFGGLQTMPLAEFQAAMNILKTLDAGRERRLLDGLTHWRHGMGWDDVTDRMSAAEQLIPINRTTFLPQIVQSALLPVRPLVRLIQHSFPPGLQRFLNPKQPGDETLHHAASLFGILEQAKANASRLTPTGQPLSYQALFHLMEQDAVVADEVKRSYGAALTHLSAVHKAHYDNAKATSWFKLVGMLSYPFAAFDGYNATLKETHDKKQAIWTGKERLLQSFSMFAVSLWVVAASNHIFRNVYNASLPGAVGITLSNALVSNILNRMLIGLPVLPKSRASQEAMRRKRLNQSGLKGTYHHLIAQSTGRLPTPRTPPSTPVVPFLDSPIRPYYPFAGVPAFHCITPIRTARRETYPT